MSYAQDGSVATNNSATEIPFLPVLTIDVATLAPILGKSVASIRSDLSRNPCSLPPRLDLGGKKPLWLLSAVVNWLESRVVVVPELPAEPEPKRSRGRPTKAEQVRRQRAAARTISGRAA